MRYPIITILLLLIATAAYGRGIHGKVSEADSGEPLAYATVVANPGNHVALTDADGAWQLNLPDGRYTIVVSYIGWLNDTLRVVSPSAKPLEIRTRQSARQLREVVITAREGQGITSASRIDREAMQHLQPTSFTDLLELLPGNISQTPDMGKANTITLRETGSVSATGAKTDTSDDYAITSLGTMFVVDGAPVNTDANLQNVPSASSTDPEGRRNITNKGVDMRTISTDNIESVEIVRGIPSAEYGNLTSGLVNIRRIRRATPLTARFKADEYSKLFSAGKGLSIGRQVINADAGYLDSRSDPRDSRENYKRFNGSLRAHLTWGTTQSAIATDWTVGADYTGSIDNVKPDPDLNYNKIDEYKSSYNRWALTSDLTLKTQRCSWLEYLRLNGSVSYQHDRLTRRKQVAPQRASVAPTSMSEGVSDGRYLLQEYVADYVSDGRPLSAFVKLSALGRRSSGRLLHTYKAGVELSSTKNFGDGQVYDLTRPISAAWTTRPRAYKDIPTLNIVSGYIEESLNAPIGASSLELQAGLRTQTIAGLDGRYRLSGKVYLDPRLNAVINFPAIEASGQPMHFMAGGGFGLTTKMPTVDYLFPQAHYNDLIQLNYYDISDPLHNSRVSLRTYIDNPTNYDLRAARNRKWEVRAGADWGANRISVTFFSETLRSGYRYSSVYDAYALHRYDASGIEPGSLTAPPELSSLPYEDTQILDGYRKVTNGSRIDKRGIEYTIATARWQAIGTSLIINGAWLRSRYSNSQMLFTPVSDVVGSTAVSDRYVGLYATDDGRINEQLNTNFTFDTQIPRWGLIFSTSIQCMWYVKTRRMRDNGVPTYYISADDGQLHPYSEADHTDVMLQYLVRHFNEAAYTTQTVPPAIYLNLKATKKIGRVLQISAFVNRIVDYLPDYTSNGLTIRRTSSAYFGMEATLSF
ncbi:MAG: TonB-dependent receptor [Paramuribaculum sp.]|nr:TonB-dependent receptor [Paramuribaculum sp.]